MHDLPPPDVMKRAFYAREVAFDGVFFTAVRTTNVFCRPSCAARKPLEKNIAFFGSAKDALFAGFRPCLRCRPMDEGETPEWVRAIVGKVETNPHQRLRDGDLRRMGVEPARARRWFQARYGMTFHAWARALRLGDALRRIRSGEAIDDVAIASGWESHSGFREAFGKFFGEAPRQASTHDPIVATMIDSPLGPLVAAAVDEGICLLEFSDRRMLEKQIRPSTATSNDRSFREVILTSSSCARSSTSTSPGRLGSCAFPSRHPAPSSRRRSGRPCARSLPGGRAAIARSPGRSARREPCAPSGRRTE